MKVWATGPGTVFPPGKPGGKAAPESVGINLNRSAVAGDSRRMGKSAEKFSKQDQTMKSLVRLLKLQALLMALGIMGGWARAGDPACLLNLPLPPHSEADGFVRLTYGSPAGAGVSPEFSLFTVDILPPGGAGGSPTPPVPAGRYAAWCFDVATDIDPGRTGATFGGTAFRATIRI